MKRGLVPNIGNELIEEGIIRENFTENKIVKITNDLFRIFHDSGIEKKLGHERILANLIKEDKNSIASEVPVWHDTPEPITGHIDLIRIEDDFLHIVDYKPEGSFMRSIPQVAYYGYLMKRNLNVKNVLCSSFNKDSIWTYEPYELLERTNEIIKRYATNAEFDWQFFI